MDYLFLIGKTALSLALFYAIIVAALYALQTKLLFPAWMAKSDRDILPEAAERLSIETPDGERLVGIRLGDSAENSDQIVLLAFGGNAWNADELAMMLHNILPDVNVVAFHYRGYGPSSGRPRAETLQSDSVHIFDYLRDTIPNSKIIAVGLSIGAGVAAHLASRRPLSGAVLITPFDSLEKLAQKHYPWLPVSLLFRHQMEPAREVAHSTVPFAIIAADRDTIVPNARTDKLRASIPNLIYDRTIAGAGHNSLYQHPEFAVAVEESVEALEERRVRETGSD